MLYILFAIVIACATSLMLGAPPYTKAKPTWRFRSIGCASNCCWTFAMALGELLSIPLESMVKVILWKFKSNLGKCSWFNCCWSWVIRDCRLLICICWRDNCDCCAAICLDVMSQILSPLIIAVVTV